mmetsp:Transcript_98761/g.171127  ORF Transcript_98761/g.171127 Transcript_98761/m.171127 type:complete len:1125 (-) Transcript_98761:50-3424(-)
MGRLKKRVVEDSDEEVGSAMAASPAAPSAVPEPRQESAVEGLPGKRRRLVLRGATSESLSGKAIGCPAAGAGVDLQEAAPVPRLSGRKKRRQIADSSCSEPEAPQGPPSTPVASETEQKIPPAAAEWALADSDGESDGLAPAAKRPAADTQHRGLDLSDAEASHGERVTRRPLRACVQRARAKVQDFVGGVPEALAASDAESSDSSASSDRIANRRARGSTTEVTSSRQRRPKQELPNVDGDPEVEVWQEDLNSRCATSSDLSSAFSRSPCGQAEIRRLSPKHFIASQPIFDMEGQVNLHLLLGAVRMLASSAEAWTSADSRRVLWLAARARGLGLVVERELEKGRLSRRAGAAGHNGGSRRQRAKGGRRPQAAFGGGSAEPGPLLMGGEVRFPVRPPAHKRRAPDGDAAPGSSQAANRSSDAAACSKAAEHVEDDLFSDAEDEMQQFVRRKRAVMELRTRYQHRRTQITSLSSHAVNMEEVTTALTAPKLSFDWENAPKDQAQEDGSDDDGGGMLEVTVPDNDPHRDSKRSLFRDHISQKMSALRAQNLMPQEASAASAVKAEPPGMATSAASSSAPPAAEPTAGLAEAAAEASEAPKELAAEKQELAASSVENVDPSPSPRKEKESVPAPQRFEVQHKAPKTEKEEEEDGLERMVFRKSRGRRLIVDDESDDESSIRVAQEVAADALPDSAGRRPESAAGAPELAAASSVVEPIRSVPRPGTVLSLLVAPTAKVTVPVEEAEAEAGTAVASRAEEVSASSTSCSPPPKAHGVLAKLLAPTAAVPTPTRCPTSPTADAPGAAAPASSAVAPLKVLPRVTVRRSKDNNQTQDLMQKRWKKQALLLDIFKRSTASAKGSIRKGLSRLRRVRICLETSAESRSAEQCGDAGTEPRQALQEAGSGSGDAREPEVLASGASSGGLEEDGAEADSADEEDAFEEESGDESLVVRESEERLVVRESEDEDMQGESDEECSDDDLDEVEAAADRRRRREALREKRRQARKHERRLRWELEDMAEIGDEVERIVHLGTTTMSEEDLRRWRKVIGAGSAPSRPPTEQAAGSRTSGTVSATSTMPGSTTVAHRGGGRRLCGGRGEDDGGHLYTLAGGSKTPRAKFLGARQTQQH